MKRKQEDLAEEQIQQFEPLSVKMAKLSTFDTHPNQLSALEPRYPHMLKSAQSDPQIAKTAPVRRRQSELLFNEMRLFELQCNQEGKYCSMRQLPARMIHNFTGQGMLVLPNGKRFRGEWVDGMIVGEAQVYYPNGNLYKGSLYNYQKHGWGTLRLGRGESYEGQFIAGDFHGQGTLFSKQGGIIYKGQWRRGKRHDR